MKASDLRHAYAVLELSPPFTEARLKRRYKTLVKRWHPDQYQADPIGQAEATERLRQINIAYELVRASFGSSEPAPIEIQVDTRFEPPTNVEAPTFLWPPDRVDAIVESINRMNRWSLLPDVPDMSDWNRITSGLIALVWLGQCALYGGSAGAMLGALLISIPLVCIWFPEELGNRAMGPDLTTPTSGCAIQLFGWLFLVALFFLFFIVVGGAG
jgi:hypothetical protein